MRNWPFHLSSQILRGNWFMNPDHALSMGGELDMILNPAKDLKLLSTDLLEARGPLPVISFSEGSDTDFGYDQLPEGSIAIFRISGTMLKYGTLCSYGTEEIAHQMIAAAQHKNISGALIEGDSGGGGVNSIAPLLNARQYFAAAGKPVVGLFDSCYSAMYYFAAGLDHIMASNNISAGFGSIGVMMTFMDIYPYYEKMGVVRHVIIPPESSEKNAAAELALKKDYARIKAEQLSPLAVGFQNHVLVKRAGKLVLDEEKKVIKGQTYFADDSIKNGLADSIGNRQAAIDLLFDMIEVNKFLKSK